MPGSDNYDEIAYTYRRNANLNQITSSNSIIQHFSNNSVVILDEF